MGKLDVKYFKHHPDECKHVWSWFKASGQFMCQTCQTRRQPTRDEAYKIFGALYVQRQDALRFALQGK